MAVPTITTVPERYYTTKVILIGGGSRLLGARAAGPPVLAGEPPALPALDRLRRPIKTNLPEYYTSSTSFSISSCIGTG